MLSVIVPVYNCEKTITKCVKSIINQDYKNLELLLIDDGSTDDSAQVCKSLALDDERIRFFTGPNIGAIGARKKGFDLSKGEAVTFVDADDWIESGMYTFLMSIYEQNDVDLVTSGYCTESKDKINQIIDSVPEGLYLRNEIYSSVVPYMMHDEMSNLPGITQPLVNKIFKKSKLENILKNSEDTVISDDAKVTYVMILEADSIYITHNIWYHYIMNENSKTHRHKIEMFEGIRRFMTIMESYYEKYGVLNVMRSQLEAYVRSLLDMAIRNTYEIEIKNTNLVFPYEYVERGSRIVIHGAGNVGKSYWQYVKDGNYVKVIGWVDAKESVWIDTPNYRIESPKNVINMEFDYIVIAIYQESIANEIRNEYIKLGVEPNKILWVEPKYL